MARTITLTDLQSGSLLEVLRFAAETKMVAFSIADRARAADIYQLLTLTPHQPEVTE